MKRNILKRILTEALILSVFAAIFTGCGDSNAAATTEDGVKLITVGSGNSYEPYCYLDEKGNPTGYEYAVLQAVDEILPDYEFKYESMSFDNVLLSLDAKKVDIAAHQFEYTDERAEKYLYGTVPYTDYTTRIIVKADNNDVNSLDDLQGKVINGGGVTSATNTILQNYNKEHPDTPLIIQTNETSTDEQRVTALQSGLWTADAIPERDAEKLNREYGNGTDIVKAVGEPINRTSTYYVYRKDNAELQQAIDGALAQLKENGTLAQLSEEWLGGDYTGSDSE